MRLKLIEVFSQIFSELIIVEEKNFIISIFSPFAEWDMLEILP